jgi:hypothetical protein
MKNFILAIALLLGVASVGSAGEVACETKCVTRCTPVRNVVSATLKVAERAVVAPFKLLDCLCTKAKPVCAPVCQQEVKPCEPVAEPACEPVVKPACEPVQVECAPVCKERSKPLRKALNNLKAKCKATKCECVVTAVKQCGC